MTRSPTFRLTASRTILSGRVFRLDRETWLGPNGPFTRETVVHPGAVAVLPRSGRDRFLLIRQFRAAARGWLLEIPAGTLEKGESALACAKRELAEETGYAARRWRKLGAILVAPGYSTEVIHVYEASGLRRASAEKDQDEHIEVVDMSRRELARAARSGKIRDGKSLSALWLGGVR